MSDGYVLGYLIPGIVLLWVLFRVLRVIKGATKLVMRFNELELSSGGPLTATSIPPFSASNVESGETITNADLVSGAKALVFIDDSPSVPLVWSSMELVRLRLGFDSLVYVFYSGRGEGWRRYRDSNCDARLRSVWLVDNDGVIATAFRVQMFPTTVGVSPDGYIEWVAVGAQSPAVAPFSDDTNSIADATLTHAS